MTRYPLYSLWIILNLFVIVFSTTVSGQITDLDLRVLKLEPSQPQSEELMRRYLRDLSYEAFDHRLENYERLKTTDQIRDHQAKLKQFFLEKLNLPKEKTPLNARLVDRKQFEDFTVEKLIFESQPGFYVPALFYLPKTTKPCPAVLVLCGHNEMGKAYDQEICVGLVRNGIAALCIDPIGQGERKQVLDENGQGPHRATLEHVITGIAPILLGKCLATYMVWDAIRSLDYLETRPEIDASKLGVTGYSGGGNRGSYLMAIDDRIQCAAPGCYITTSRRKNDAKGPGDAEQNFHGQFSFGLDLPDYLIMRAPKPVLILSASQDFVPIEGTWEAFRQAKRIYTRFGNSDRVEILETDNTHGYWPEMQVGAINWMRRWLMDVHEPIVEQPYTRIDEEELLCTPQGQVLLMPGAKSVFDLNREAALNIADERERFLTKAEPESVRAKIRELTGIRNAGTLPQAKVVDRGSVERNGYTIKKLVLEWDVSIQLPVLFFVPSSAAGESFIYVNSAGKITAADPAGDIEQLVQKGHSVLAVDVRGIGETETSPWRYEYMNEFTGHDVANFWIAYMLEKTFVGMWAEDIMVSARYLRTQIPNNSSIRLISLAETGPAALHAAALEPAMFKSLTLENSLESWTSVVEFDVTKNVLNSIVHDALRHYDLPDLIELIGDDQVIRKNPIDAGGALIAILK